MPLIQKYIRHLFHKAPMVQGNCDELIALGLGLVCGVKERKEEIKDYILTDICPFSLGVATINEADPDRAYMANIINRNAVFESTQILYGIGSAGLCSCGGTSGRKYLRAG